MRGDLFEANLVSHGRAKFLAALFRDAASGHSRREPSRFQDDYFAQAKRQQRVGNTRRLSGPRWGFDDQIAPESQLVEDLWQE